MIDIIPATKEHAVFIQEHMRQEHRDEMQAYGMEISQSLVGPLERSAEAWTGTINGEPAAMWGLEPPLLIGPLAFIWMLGTEKLRTISKTIAKESRVFVDYASQKYSVLECHVDPRYTQAMNWIRWLGFYSAATVQSTSGAPIVVFRKER